MVTTTLHDERREPDPGRGAGTVEIAVPVFNEEVELEASVRRLRRYLDEQFPFAAAVTVVDNASTDGTFRVAQLLAAELPGVRAVRLEQKGRGRAIRTVWTASPAAVVVYMDVDLSTDLDALLPLVAPLLSGHSDVAIGSRLAPGSHVVRGPKREVLSRGYNLLIRALLRNRFTDAQCGFKAVRSDVARTLLPQVHDDAWFFDTELLVQAERAGLRIHEVPVDWVDDPDSRVDIATTVAEDLKGVWRLLRQPGPNRGLLPRVAPDLASFARIGVPSAVADVVLFLLLRSALGTYAANAVALVLCSAANLAAHLRFSAPDCAMGARAVRTAWAAALAAGLTVSTALLAVAEAVAPGSATAAVLAVLAASGIVAIGRFLLLRALVFRRHRRDSERTTK